MVEEPVAGWSDPGWRKAERRRVLLLNLPPGALQRFARRGTPQLVAVALLQVMVVVGVGLAVLRMLNGSWLPSYAGLVVLAVGVLTQTLCRVVNTRAQP